MPQATIMGSLGTGGVSAIAVTTGQTQVAAQVSLNSISNLLVNGFNGANITYGNIPSTPIIGSITGSTSVNLGALANNVQSLLISNSSTTIVANSKFIGNESIVAGLGGLTFTDNGASTSIIVGGGTNTVNFGSGSTNATFIGDGANTLNLSTASGATSVFGTSNSADTINGTAGTGSNVTYTSAQGASLFINPNAGNVTVFGAGGTGTETVFGGSLVNTFTGRLTVVDGTGYFQAGAAGNNTLGSSTVGSTTLIGGGGNDILSAKGFNDVLVAGSGSATLDGSHSVGGDTFWASNTGTSLMYGGNFAGDTFYTNTSTILGTGFKGSFINLHTGPNSPLRGLNNNVQGTVNVGFSSNNANYVTIGDFISGVDKLVLNTAVTGSNYTLTSGTLVGSNGPVTYTNVQTTNGSFITVYNAIVTNNDITKI